MIFSLPGTRGLGDLQLFWRPEWFCGHISAPPRACLDIPIRHELPSFLIEEWQNRCDDARSAIVAENQIL